MARSPLNNYDKKVRNAIANNLKTLLDSRNLTQVELSELVNIPASTLSGYFAKRSTPTPGNIQKLADFFEVNKSDIDPRYNYNISKNTLNPVEENNDHDTSHDYKYFPVSVSAGPLENIEAQSDCISISLPNSLLGKYAGKKDIIILKVNGESMNNIIPDGSFIVVDTSRKQVSDINDRDIVVFAENGSYSLKRYINDKNNQRFLFKPDSTDDTFTPIEVSYEESINLKLIGRVVKYVVNLY